MERIVTTPKTTEECTFLAKPSIKTKDLTYVKGNKMIYVNLFKISILKNWVIYQYPISFEPEVAKDNPRMKRALYLLVESQVKKIYGDCFMSGDSIFAFKEIKELKQIPFSNPRNNLDYLLIIRPFSYSFAISDENPLFNPAIKQVYELIFKEILRANPNLEFYRNLFVKKTEKKEVSSQRSKVDFFPGYTTSLVYTPQGPFINVSIKNKILSTNTCLEIIQSKKTSKGTNYTRDEEEDIRDCFIGRSIKTSYNKKNYIVDDISFDKTPKTTSINKDGETINLVNYYKVAHGITIKDPNQPLIVVNKIGTDQKPVTLYFIPELCCLAGIDDSMTKDGNFMKSLASYTKLTPKERVAMTNDFLPLLDEKKNKQIVDSRTKKVLNVEPSPYEKKNIFALQVAPADKNTFNAHFMKTPTLIAGKNTKISPEERKPVPVTLSKDLTNWLCVYHNANYEDAENLKANLQKACKSYGIKVSDPEWAELKTTKLSDWIEEVNYYTQEKKYDMVVFVLDRYIDKLYKGLKLFSLCENGFRSQVVKVESMKKNAMSVASKILLQINAKMGGVTYKVDFEKDVKNQNLMIVGVDSSHISGKRTGVAMTATMNNDFTQYYNKIDVIDEKKKETLVYCVSAFLMEAVPQYFKLNKKLPSGVIIYRQGVSRQQKEFLKEEVKFIEDFLNGTGEVDMFKSNPIPYYYILVNTKTSYKFFEKVTQRNTVDYANPERGLLVMDDITDPAFFEFYIQPQDVTQGTATPTSYHVAFGNMNFPEFIPKLTFDLSFLYANWTGPVRVPGPLKSAEKLSKMTAKYTKKELHNNLKSSQAYL